MKASLIRVFCLVLVVGFAGEAAGWESRRIIEDFYAEGAAVGDIDGDGSVDLAYGPFWVAGPTFVDVHRFAEGEAFAPTKGYSNIFFSFIHDCDGDGNNDVLVFGFPGKDARLYLNPGKGKRGELWPEHVIADQLCGESPHFVDIVKGGIPEIVGARDTAYGYYEAGGDVTKPWKWRAISKEKTAAKPFGHGMGVGDVDGDGRLDVVEKQRWYAQPKSPGSGLWEEHRWALVSYGGGGAQILVDDVDGDGDSDLITSLNAHAYGISWFEQTGPGKFARHDIIGKSSIENAHGVAFSQPHAMALADIDGDGRKDFVSGKRWMAHQGKDQGSAQEAVLYWFKNEAGADGVEFVPHLIDNDSGVGVDVIVADVNADGQLDVVGGSKKGLSVHLQDPGKATGRAPRWKVKGGRPDADYATGRTPVEAAKAMEVPEGFAVDLVAGEPDLVQPIAMCFDARGRIWVVEAMSYPQRREDAEAEDRILILEDADKDGSFETRKVFADGLNLVSGIEVGFGGVWVGAAPYLHFYADADGDDVPDGEPEVLLDGWHYEDTHETLNSFTWGPDGWLYGCHGVFTHSVVGKPGTPEDERVKIDAGIWRYHPTRHEFEVFAEGTSNPWGVDFDEKGDWYLTACVIPHFFHVIQGARYFRQGGQHFNPYIYEDITTIADHLHYGDGSFASANASGKVDRALTRDKPADTSAVGGGHAHCGLAIYDADVFPEQYRGDHFFHNLHGHRIVRERVENEGSGSIARHRPDFMLAKDHAYVGVGVMLGPDGALYALDWHDPQTCHHRDVEIWDRSNGRIFRVRYGEVKTASIDLPGRSDLELVDALRNANAFVARQAQRILQERAAAGTLKSKAVAAAVREMMRADEERRMRLRGLWAGRVCGLVDEGQLAGLLEDGDAYVRGWAVQLLCESEEELKGEVHAKFVAMAREDSSAVVRRYLAAALQRMAHAQRWDVIAGLGSHAADHYDRNLPLLTWYGMEPLVGENPERALALADGAKFPRLAAFAGRRAAVTPEGRDALLSRIALAKNGKEFSGRADAFLASVETLPNLETPPSWGRVVEAAKKYPKDFSVLRLGARLGDAESFPYWRKVVRNEKAPGLKRAEALKLLTLGRDPELGAIASNLIQKPPLRAQALASLRGHVDEVVAGKIVAALPGMPVQLRNDAVNLLASRADSTKVLLGAIEAKDIDASLVSLVLLRQMRQLKDGEVNRMIDATWGFNETPEGIGHVIFRWKRTLNADRLARADHSKGRQVFSATCGTCHTLFGSGIALGPDLTGSNRANLDYLLENVLAPNAVVGTDYQLNVFTLKDGGVVSGMVRREEEQVFTVAMPGGTEVAVDKKTVAERKVLKESLMPAGLFDALPENDVVNLVAYLGSAAQVAMPGGGGAAEVAGPVDPLEGEALAAGAKVSAGKVRPQKMGNFTEGEWSGNAQLFWTGGKPGATMELAVPVAKAGVYNLRIDFTTARDYGKVRVSPGKLKAREVDLYSPLVKNAEPVVWEKVRLDGKAALPVKIEVTGANAKAAPSFMVGIDRVELTPAGPGAD